MKIVIGHIYPELLNMYGDRGNVIVLKKRLEMRGIECEVKEFKREDEINLDGIDILFIGGGSDREILTALDKLSIVKEKLKSYIEEGNIFLAVCSAYELISKEFYLKGEKYEGLGLIDVRASWNDKRFVSDVVIKTEFGTVAGFENHNGRMVIGNNIPLGKVVYGSGNNGEDKTEGIIYKNTFATYLDGPVLPKNPELCDEIIKRALEKKYQKDISLKELDDSVEFEAKNYIVNKYTSNI